MSRAKLKAVPVTEQSIPKADMDRINQIGLLQEHVQAQLELLSGLFENLDEEDRRSTQPPGCRGLTIPAVVGGAINQLDQMRQLLVDIGNP